MSILLNPVRPQSFALPANHYPILLQYRFDFRQKTSGMPPLEMRLDDVAGACVGVASLVLVFSKNLSDFSNPAWGGAKPSKAVSRRIGIRHFSRRPLGTAKRKDI
jgi:hypothetical protein